MMPRVTVDDIEYNTEDLTETGRATLASLQFLESQMQQMRNEMSVYRVAQLSYIAALKVEIERSDVKPITQTDQPDDEA
tara:strand:- start:1300 stop:1536 length:237 start_codon:yes stop_codon:yes gene_type:complete